MKWRTLFSTAFINLGAAKLRTFLALLGISVGTGAVVALMSLGLIATEKAVEQFKALGTDLIAVSVFPQTNGASTQQKRSISLNTWKSLPQHIPKLQVVAPYNTVYKNISFEGVPLKGVIVGADAALAPLLNLELSQGQFLDPLSIEAQQCVIGSQIAEQIKSITASNPLHKLLRLESTVCVIAGMIKPAKENAFFNQDINQAIILPVATTAYMSKDALINNAIMRIASDDHIEEVTQALEFKLRESEPQSNIFIRSAQQIIQQMEKQGHIFTLLLSIIGGIALLVGGVGIMNIMLVSVSERKQEIGIRKACGSTSRGIQALFLAESTLIASIGGFIGLFLGVLSTWLIAQFSHWPFQWFLTPLVLSFVIAMSVGVFFGFYPARRAANQEVVHSLRGD